MFTKNKYEIHNIKVQIKRFYKIIKESCSKYKTILLDIWTKIVLSYDKLRSYHGDFTLVYELIYVYSTLSCNSLHAYTSLVRGSEPTNEVFYCLFSFYLLLNRMIISIKYMSYLQLIITHSLSVFCAFLMISLKKKTFHHHLHFLIFWWIHSIGSFSMLIRWIILSC